MEFKTGDFIHHNHYGVGRILDTADLLNSISTSSIKEYTIRFQDGEVKTLPQELLDRGAHQVSSEGFRAYWYLDETRAKELLTTDPVEVITMVLHDFPGQQAKNEDFKEYLAPYVLNWMEWWEITQPKLKDSPLIDTSQSKLRIYALRRDALSRAEEIYRSFNRIRSKDKNLGYDEARRILAEYRNGASLRDEHLEDVLNYVKLII
jgi:transcription elongation factor GreA-like protein